MNAMNYFSMKTQEWLPHKKSIMLSLTIIFLLANSLWSKAQTIVSEDSVSGKWLEGGSPYLIMKDITIPVGATLTIEPGTVIHFAGNYALRISGKLTAIGTRKKTITFSTADSSEMPVQQTSGTNNDLTSGWKGIRFSIRTIDMDTSSIAFCVIQDVQALVGTGEDCAGGAICIRGNSVVIVKNCHLLKNKAHLGAAIFIDGNNAIIDANLIEHNESLSNGGAIYLTKCRPVLKNNLIRFNKSSEFGGGLYCDKAYGTFINNTFAQNFARFGGAISLNKSNPRLINNTIADNHAEVNGGAIHCQQSSPFLKNSIVWGNDAHDRGRQLYLYAYGYPDIEYSTVEGGERAVERFSDSLNYVNNYENNIEYDPLFLQNDSVYYGLDEFSPCIDAGYNNDQLASETMDMNGRPRILNKIIDMGAQEFWMNLNKDSTEIKPENESEDKQKDFSVLIYPNPSQGRFMVEITDPEADITSMGIISPKGQLFYLKNFNVGQSNYAQEMELDINRGFYFLELKNSKGQVVKRGKIIIE
jgi:predicted outer membrane repeat protein